jgi:hypothetical protein
LRQGRLEAQEDLKHGDIHSCSLLSGRADMQTLKRK